MRSQPPPLFRCMDNQSTLERALLLERSNRYSEAYLLFEDCLQTSDYDRGDLLFHLGWCIENGDTRNGVTAVELYQKAAEETLVPMIQMNALFRAGWLAMHAKDYSKAATLYKRAIECKETYGLETEIYPHAAYWYAVCAETTGKFLEALEWYARAQALSPILDPESRYRQIRCKTQIGAYIDALRLCMSFESPPTDGFSAERYSELQALAGQERKMIEATLAEKYAIE